MLDDAYDMAKAEEIDEQVKVINKDRGFGKMMKVWKLVHGISERNKAYAGKIDGATEEERVKTWQGHFEGLLGKPPKVSTILKDLPKKKLKCPRDDSEFSMSLWKNIGRLQTR